MDYFALIKRALNITLKNRFLWIFGFFAGAVGGFSGYNFGSGRASEQDLNGTISRITQFYQSHPMAVLTGMLFLLLLMVLMFILSIISQASLIASVAKLNQGEKVNFRKGFNWGGAKFWQIWGVMIVFSLIMLAVLIVLGLPVVLLAVSQNFIIMMLWLILAMFLFIPVCIVISILMPYAQRFIVLENAGVAEGIRKSYDFAKKHMLDVFVVYLSLIGIGVIYAIGSVVALIISACVFGLIGMGFMLVSDIAGMIFISLAVATILFGLFTATGAYAAMQSSVITLAYEQLKHKN